MITARNSIVLALLSVITGRAAAQLPASAPTAVGTWRGTSLCQVRPSPCSDENIVYRITRVGLGDSLSIDGRKIVNGREEEMGIIGCHVLATRDEVVCSMPRGAWHFTVRGDSLTGELRLPDNTRIRDVRTARSRS